MTDPSRLVDAYLDGQLTQAQFDQLEQDLSEQPRYADAFAQAMLIDAFLKDKFERDVITSTMRLGDGEFLNGSDLSVLIEDYNHAVVHLVDLDKARPKPVDMPPKEKPVVPVLLVLAHEAADLSMKLIRSKAGAFAALAAVLLLGLWLINPFAGSSQRPAPQAEQIEQADPSAPTPLPRTTVATLTATHNATWAEGASAPGSQLQTGDTLTPNQHLTLTQGFAEITTARGAVAILEAPATIELINDNTIHLHTGKLVGLCHTESSKGFLVRTPHMDVIDLGTEFGVEVQGNNFMATVFTGEIELAFPGSDAQTLTQNQTGRLRVDGDSRELIVQDKLAQGFEALLPHRVLANALRNDPAMIAYYDFEAEDIVDGKLLNRAVATLGTMDGVLGQPGRPDSQPQITQGRVPGSSALRFEASEFDIMRVSAEDAQALDGLEQFTIGLWVRPDDMERTSHHLITMRQSRGENDALNLALVWEGPRDKEFRLNSVLFHTNLGKALIERQTTAADSLQRRSAWVHVLVTFDRGERAIYIDGQLQAKLPRGDSDRVPATNADLLIGAAKPLLHDSMTYLDGDLDELFILGRSLSDTEIQALYQAGVPLD